MKYLFSVIVCAIPDLLVFALAHYLLGMSFVEFAAVWAWAAILSRDAAKLRREL